MKNKFLLVFTAAIILALPQKTFSQESSQSSAKISIPEISQTGSDSRVKVLHEFLKNQNSPLTDNASDFVTYADKYNLDWKLVAAISGVESTFGKRVPPYSYNGWGWGVYGSNIIRFASWKDGIATVSAGLREKYMNSWGASDIYEIGDKYAASPVWATHVQFYINKINYFALANPQYALSLSY